MERMMEYKGYHAKIEYSAEDNTFFGKVFGIDDTLIFDGNSIDELNNAFHESIDDYIEMCREIGKEPCKEFKGSFNVRISPELHRIIALKAEAEETSLNQLVSDAITSFINPKNENLIFIVEEDRLENIKQENGFLSSFSRSKEYSFGLGERRMIYGQ